MYLLKIGHQMSETIKGGNGDIHLDFEKGTATKYFRNISSQEKISRFTQELHVVKELSNKHLANLVEILEVKIDEKIKNSYIVMKLYDGTLYDLFRYTKGNVKYSCELLLPIVVLLKKLSEQNPAIYHRDLKPDNILYKQKESGEIELVLTDFGMCYLADDSERITPNEIAIGARHFMAPEYEIGRVENVTEKGDIYSIGKILWCMINGSPDEFLPSNFWFIDEYNLQNRFSRDKNIILANILISSCLAIDPTQRSTYDEIIKHMTQIVTGENIHYDSIKQLNVKAFTEKRKLELIEILQKNRDIVNAFSISFVSALEKINIIYQNFPLTTKIQQEYQRNSKDGINYSTPNVERNSDHYLYSMSFDDIYFHIDYIPARNGETFGHIEVGYTIRHSNKSISIKIQYENMMIKIIKGSERLDFSELHLYEFLDDMISEYIR